MDSLWYLHGKDFFTGIEEQKEAFLKKSVCRRYQKNYMIFFEGDAGDACFYVASGLVRIFSVTDSGKESIFFLRRAGEVFGVSEVLNGYPRKANAQTITPAEIHVMRRADFDVLLERNYPLARRVISLLGSRIRQLGDSISNLATLSVEDRLIKLLIALVYDLLPEDEDWQRPVHVPVRISQEQMASMVGATPPTISELLRKLQKEGLVRVARCSITLLNPLQLFFRVSC